MKRYLILIASLMMVALSVTVNAQNFDDEVDEVSEHMKLFKEKYEASYPNTFEEVAEAVTKVITDRNCMIGQDVLKMTEDGLYKGVIKSDMCVFVEGTDSTFRILQSISVLQSHGELEVMPFIRGAQWTIGRFIYKFIIKEKHDGTSELVLRGEVSGYDNYVTNEFHFWRSNGILETKILEDIAKELQPTE
ncbi:MAG: hypothetical protein PF588_09385 [Candidatus Kapabacteria bacterium]|jgi:hypothetical protein|nr:hypothetical protein [Candidatus Kapabacteria bacterium]